MKMKLCPSLACALAFFAGAAMASEFYVAPGGADANPGSQAQPFASLERARDAIRELKKAGPLAAPVTVWLRGGVYDLSVTVGFDGRDSGTAAAPVVYSGWPGEEVRITGGRSLPAAAFAPVTSSSPLWGRLDATARGQVYAVDLRALGLTDFGTLRPRGFGLAAAAPLELFFNQRPMTLAQWPNRRDAWARTVSAASASSLASPVLPPSNTRSHRTPISSAHGT